MPQEPPEGKSKGRNHGYEGVPSGNVGSLCQAASMRCNAEPPESPALRQRLKAALDRVSEQGSVGVNFDWCQLGSELERTSPPHHASCVAHRFQNALEPHQGSRQRPLVAAETV